MGIKIYGLPTGSCFTKLNTVMVNGETSTVNIKEIAPWGKGDKGFDENMKLGDGSVGPGVSLCCYVWYIEGSKYRILVDTGYDSDESITSVIRKHGVQDQIFIRKPSEDVIRALDTINISPEDIDIVLLSHLHFDHFANTGLFNNATFIVQSEELPWAIAPPPYGTWYYKEYAHYITDVLDRVQTVEGDEWIMKGIQVWKLGGHSPGSMAIVVDTNVGRVALAGDVALTYKNLELKWPCGTIYSLPDTIKAFNRLLTEADIVIPAHDWKFLEKFPNGIVG